MKSELKAKIIALIFTAVIITCGVIKNNILIDKQKKVEDNQILAMESYVKYDLEDDLNTFVFNYLDVFEFYTDLFGISLDDFKNEIMTVNADSRLNYYDLGKIDIHKSSLQEYLIDYLFYLKKEKSELFHPEFKNGNDYTKDYVYGLLNYFSNLYDNVDFKTLASIAYIETGNLNSKYMMACNNIYGGIASTGLIKYHNIEYGVLTYVKMMSERYYGKGLDTPEKISNIYAPNNSKWAGKVYNAMSIFDDFEEVHTVEELNKLK